MLIDRGAAKSTCASPHSWGESVRTFWIGNIKEIRNASIAAAFGALASQIAFPAMAPYVDLYSYSVFGVSPWKARFLVVADTGEVAANKTKPGELLSVTRLFCGGGKICVTREIAPDRMKAPDAWRLDSGDADRVKTFVIGHDGSSFSAAYMDQKSNKPGYLDLSSPLAVSGDFVGKGEGCFLNAETNLRMIGPYYAYVGEIVRQLKDIDGRQMAADAYAAAVDQKFIGLFKEIDKGVSIAAAAPRECR